MNSSKNVTQINTAFWDVLWLDSFSYLRLSDWVKNGAFLSLPLLGKGDIFQRAWPAWSADFFARPAPPPNEPKSNKMTELYKSVQWPTTADKWTSGFVGFCSMFAFYQCSVFSSLQWHHAFIIDCWNWQHGWTLRPSMYPFEKQIHFF